VTISANESEIGSLSDTVCFKRVDFATQIHIETLSVRSLCKLVAIPAQVLAT